MVAIAVTASLLGAYLLWQRAEFYRKQAALCAFFEHQSLFYAAELENDPDSSPEERQEAVRGNLLEASHSGILKVIYGRVASHPWESLPPGTPDSVNPYDLKDLSASEIEEELNARLER